MSGGVGRASLRGVHLVSDRHLCPRLMEAVAAAIEGGVVAVHLREPDLPAGELWELARQLRALTQRRALLVINDRIDVALAVGADAVQLGARSLPVAVARRLVGRRLLLGRSVHSLPEAVQAQQDGADYLLLGTIYATRSHPDATPAGPELVRQARAAVSLPIIAIGGIAATNAPAVMQAGADGVAVISAILGAPDPRQAAADLARTIA